MRDPALAAEIVSAVVGGCVHVPVTVEDPRADGTTESVNAVEFARVVEDAGAAAIAVHGRTREQFYRGARTGMSSPASRRPSRFRSSAAATSSRRRTPRRMLERTGADAVMVARGAQGNPWIFREARALLDEGDRARPAHPFERIDMAREHARRARRVRRRARLRADAQARGVVHRRDARGQLRFGRKVNDCRSHAELDDLLAEYRAYPGARAAVTRRPTDTRCRALRPPHPGAPLRARAVLRVEVRLLRLRLRSRARTTTSSRSCSPASARRSPRWQRAGLDGVIETVYFGGGTPSLHPGQVLRTLDHIRERAGRPSQRRDHRRGESRLARRRMWQRLSRGMA